MFGNSKYSKTYRSRRLRVKHGAPVSDRQERIPGFSQKALGEAKILAVGAGGIMSEVGEGLVRKGVGHLVLCDGDTVEPTNLNRQKFYARDLWRNKAIRLARNLAMEGFLGTRVTGIPFSFAEALERGLIERPDVAVCAIDDELWREEFSRWARLERIPAVFTAVSENGDGGYVLIQRVDEACFGCVFPRAKPIRDDLDNYRAPCPGAPAIKDILKVVAGFVLYAVDSLLMERPIQWNYRQVHLAGVMPDFTERIERRPDCHLCGERE